MHPSHLLVAALALGSAGCRQRGAAAPPPAHRPAPLLARPPEQPIVLPQVARAVSDAGVTVELLHAVPSEVYVSSVVRNPTDRPENLVDGRLETAWSSRTCELEGASVSFRVPPDVTVESIGITAGMARSTDAGDYFTMNPRIRSVAVARNGVPLGTYPLDTGNRGLQRLPVGGGGGLYRVAVEHIERGTRSDWNEVSISELQVFGRAPAPSIARHVPVVRVGEPEAAAPMPPMTVPDAGGLAGGCLGWSRTRRAALCAVGSWGHNSPLGVDATSWSLVSVGDASSAAIDLAGTPNTFDYDPGQTAPTPRLESAMRARINAGQYLSLAALRRPFGCPLDWGGGATARWTERRTFGGGENQAPRYTQRLEMRWQSGAEWTTIFEQADQPMSDPTVQAYLIPGAQYLVVAMQGHFGDEGISADRSSAWVCDAVARTCSDEQSQLPPATPPAAAPADAR